MFYSVVCLIVFLLCYFLGVFWIFVVFSWFGELFGDFACLCLVFCGAFWGLLFVCFVVCVLRLLGFVSVFVFSLCFLAWCRWVRVLYVLCFLMRVVFFGMGFDFSWNLVSFIFFSQVNVLRMVNGLLSGMGYYVASWF